MELTEAIKKRSIRVYNDKPVSNDMLNRLM